MQLPGKLKVIDSTYWNFQLTFFLSLSLLQTELSYTELAGAPLVGNAVGVGGVQRLTPYCSATLGRPRQTDLKRAEPNIYSQVNVMMDDEILADWQAATVSGSSYVAGAVVDNVGGTGALYMQGYATRV